MTMLYSALHLLVDGICAAAMFGKFIPREEGYFYILLYNFCAFALQMPFGAALDILCGKGRGKPDPAFLTAAAGVLCTIAGAFTHPLVLGVGNALFHVGGGVGTIREDHAAGSRGARLGLFVAPGALGLYLGSLMVPGIGSERNFFGTSEGIATGNVVMPWQTAGEPELRVLCMGAVMLLLPAAGGLLPAKYGKGNPVKDRAQSRLHMSLQADTSVGGLRLAFCCMLVVVLRSYIGMTVTFPWKTGFMAGLLGVLAVVGGKAAGGILAARFDSRKTAAFSLISAAVCYLLSTRMPLGLAALFLFNMTMPVTLYWMVCGFPEMPGFAFGFLTFALFLGFLPVYFEVLFPWNGKILGCLGSVLSFLLLAAGMGKRKREGKRGCGEK